MFRNMEFTCITFELVYTPVNRLNFPGYGKFYQPPQNKLSYLMYVSQIVNSTELVLVGGHAGSVESLSLCRGRIAFRWYLSVSNPYLLRRSKFVHSCTQRSPYMFASANLRYHPFDSIDSSRSR